MGFTVNTNMIRNISKQFGKMHTSPIEDSIYGIKRAKGNMIAPKTKPAPKPLTAEEQAELEAKREAQRIKWEQEAEARKIAEEKRKEAERLQSLKDGTWLEKPLKMDKYGTILRWHEPESNAIKMPVIENEARLPKRIRTMINRLRKLGYAVEYLNGILKGEYIAKDQPASLSWLIGHTIDDYRHIVLIDAKNNKILGCNEKIKDMYFDRYSSPPKISLARKGQIKITEKHYGFRSIPYEERKYYDKDTGELLESVQKELYDDNPWNFTACRRPIPKSSKEGAELHKIITTRQPDGTYKTVLRDPHSLSIVEYTGTEGNRTVKIKQWKNRTDNQHEVMVLNEEDLNKLKDYINADRFLGAWDCSNGFYVLAEPTLERKVPSISIIMSALEKSKEAVK